MAFLRSMLIPALLLVTFVAAPGQAGSITGDWREPGGSIIRIAACGQDLCATLIQIASQAPSPYDLHNPDAARRSQRLCGLRIGYGFTAKDPNHAVDGHLYDPKTGKTYHGEMTSEGATLHLRGYLGIRAFGRTEDWTRTRNPGACG